jgi:uncharacterized protein (TIGR02271 family)
MAFETLVAAFDTPEHAMAAVNALKAEGFHSDDVSVFDHSRLKVGKDVVGTEPEQYGVWQRLFGDDLNHYEASVYGSTIDDGGTVVSVRVPQDQVAHASGVLDLHHPINVQDRAVTSGIAAPAHVEAAARSMAAVPLAKAQTVAVTPKLAEVHSDTLRLAEEQLQVGKKLVETGRTRVRRFTTERDAAEDVTLHEEHAEVLRQAISEPAELTDIDWADKELEVTESKEQALVSKTARVVEEVSLRKKGDDHVETIHEKLRRQQAEVERVDAAGGARGPTAEKSVPRSASQSTPVGSSASKPKRKEPWRPRIDSAPVLHGFRGETPEADSILESPEIRDADEDTAPLQGEKDRSDEDSLEDTK